MDEYEKQAKIVGVIEAVITSVAGLVLLYQILGLLIGTIEVQRRIPELVLLFVILVSIMSLLALLWNGIKNKSPGQLTGWYVVRIITTGLYILSLFFKWIQNGAPFQLQVLLFLTIVVAYCLYTTCVIKDFAKQILANRAQIQSESQNSDIPV